MAEPKIHSDFSKFCKAVNGKYEDRGKFLYCSKDYGSGVNMDVKLIKRPEKRKESLKQEITRVKKYYESFSGVHDLEISINQFSEERIKQSIDNLKEISITGAKITFKGEEDVIINKGNIYPYVETKK